MQDRDVQPSGLTRRAVLGGMGIAGLALMSSHASAQQIVDLHGGPSTRMITTSYPQKGRMILQRSGPPWLETPAEVFDKGVFTPNDRHYVSWHWVDFPSDIDVDADVMGDFSAFEWPSDLTGGSADQGAKAADAMNRSRSKPFSKYLSSWILAFAGMTGESFRTFYRRYRCCCH